MKQLLIKIKTINCYSWKRCGTKFKIVAWHRSPKDKRTVAVPLQSDMSERTGREQQLQDASKCHSDVKEATKPNKNNVVLKTR